MNLDAQITHATSVIGNADRIRELIAEREVRGIDLVIAMGREAHHPSLEERFAGPPRPLKDPAPLAAMEHHLKT